MASFLLNYIKSIAVGSLNKEHRVDLMKMGWLGALLVGLYPGFAVGTQAETLSVSTSFTFQDVRIREVDGFHRVDLVGEPAAQGIPGQPALPVKTLHILLPDQAIPSGIKIKAAEVALKGSYLVWPAQPPVPRSEPDPGPFVPPDAALYAQAALFPDRVGEMGPVQEMRGYRFLTVQLYPVRYQPASRALFLATNLQVDVEYKLPAATRTLVRAPSPLENALFRPLVSGLVANPEALEDLAQARASLVQPLAGAGTLDYLIITSAALSNAFQQLADYRSAYNGFTTRIIPVEIITATYTGVDSQAKIRNCINSLYRSNSLSYVVLGGDNTVVPDRDCHVVCGSYTENNMPTDLYYGGLDSSWDEDGDGVYGEANYLSTADEGDLAYDVMVGRIPVRTTADASAYINKLVRFESTQRPLPAFYKKVMFAGDLLWTNYTGTARPSDLCNDDHSEFQAHTPVSDAEIWKRRAYRDFVKPFWTAGVYSVFLDTLTSWDGATAGSYLQSAANLNARFNEGWHIVDMDTHGNTTIWSTESGTYGTANATALTGLTAVVYTEACLTGGFDSGEPSLSEAFLRNPTGGALIYLGCSRYGWGSPGSYYGGDSAEFAEQFLRQLFEDQVSNIGQAFIAHKIARAGSSGYDGAERWIQFGLNLQGDPGLTLSLTAPSIQLSQPTPGAQLKAGQPVTLAAETSDGFNHITNVLFLADGAPAGADDLPPYTVAWTATGAGLVTLQAVAEDDGGQRTTSTAVNVEIVANFRPAVSLTNPLEGALLPEATDVALTATASDSDGVVTQVAFLADGVWLGTDAVAPYQQNWLAPAGGAHTVQAIAWDNEGASATAKVVNVMVAREHFTEEFTADSLPDLAGWALTFTPDGAGHYLACREAITALPQSTTSATVVPLGDDDSSTVMLFGSSVSFFGITYTTFYLNSNGSLTFDREDTTFTATTASHFAQPRLSIMLRDLNPASAGVVSYQVLADRVVVTYLDVPEYGQPGTINTAQVEMFSDGRLRLSWLSLSFESAVVGLSPGGGEPEGFVSSDLSALGLCEIPPDQDGDGLPDWWEELNFGSAEDGLPHLDDDGDGQCNLDEWISGSCPTNAASCFAASNQTYQPGAGLVISWPSFSNRIYQLESATTLTGLFSTLATQLPATPPLNVYTDAVPHVGAGQFYKIRVQLEE